MVKTSHVSDAQTILIATQLVAESDLVHLQLLAAEQQHILTPKLLYRLLLNYLPPDAESITSLVTFLRHLEDGFQNISNLDDVFNQSDFTSFPSEESRHKLHELRFSKEDQEQDSTYDDGLAAFVIHWLHKIETLYGTPFTALQLLEPFVGTRPQLRLWRDAYLRPLIKLQNEFYPGRAESLDTRTMEQAYGLPGVKQLLQFAEQDGSNAKIGRDLDEVITPWIHGASQAKRRRLSQSQTSHSDTSWHNVNEWIYSVGSSDFNLAARSFLEWDGPKSDRSSSSNPHNDSDHSEMILSYTQTGLALIATSTGTGNDTNNLLQRLLDRAVSISATSMAVTAGSLQHAISDASKLDLLDNYVLRQTNPITFPHEEAFRLLESCLMAQGILENVKLALPMITILDIAIFGSEERQKLELVRILQQIPRLTRAGIDWPAVRHQLHTLQHKDDAALQEAPSGVNIPRFLGRVPTSYFEEEFLDVLIANGQYPIVSDIYLSFPNRPLAEATVQQHVVSAIYSAYDNASNGNRTRGNMKRANEILDAFRGKFRSTEIFDHIDHLIRATHSLSFYQLTLQHGVPFQPATIRVHHDPVSLIEKVLAQNHKAFTKLDDLLQIGRNLVHANLPNSTDPLYFSKSLEERLFEVQHRITYLAITSALTDHDFDTAYSYITTRLSTSPSQMSQSPFTDDTSWRAAYAAGKYRPLSSPKNLHDRITGLSKRMDLLSLALTLTPTPDPLSEILATWRRCEEEMDSLKSQAVEEERAVDAYSRANSTLPGGFTEERDMDAAETRRMMERRALGGAGPTYEEDSPMGLFDVARGAASAFRRSAFPLRGAGAQVNIRDRVEHDDISGRESTEGSRPSSEQQRVRKRDMVSNMVTGGLVSGMSWMLGAPPPPQTDERP